MAVTITVTPDEKMWQDFYAAHYAADRNLKIRFWYGFLCLTLGAFGLGGLFAALWPSLLLLLCGLYCVLSPQIMLVRSLRKIRRHDAIFHRPVTYHCDTNGLTAQNELGSAERRWNDYASYLLAAPGILLYLSDGTFLPLPRTVCTDAEWAELLRLIERSRLPQR